MQLWARHMLALIILLFLAVFVGAALAQDPPPGCDAIPPAKLDNPITYTSAPRDMSVPLGGYWEDASALQTFSDVGWITQGFGETDVKIKEKDGTTTVVYNCTNSPVECAAQDSKPSPDGKKLALSVTFGKLWQHNSTRTMHFGDPIHAKIYIYDIASKTLTQVPNQAQGAIYRMPDWIDNDTLVLSANAGNFYPVRDQWNCHGGTYADGRKRGFNNGECVSQSYPYSAAGKAMQIWRMDIDGTKQVNLTPQESNAIRPTVLRHPKNKGRIAYTSWQNSEDECFYQGAAGPGTCLNLWWLMTMGTDGTSPTAFMGAHHSPVLFKGAPQPNFQQVEMFMALRNVSEDASGKLCWQNYYRRNHLMGLGAPWCVDLQLGDFQVEGCATAACVAGNALQGSKDTRKGGALGLPSGVFSVAPFGVGSDNQQNIDSKGRAVGKAGYISAMANGHNLMTWCKGWCYNQQGEHTFNGKSSSIGGAPLADANIVEMLVPVVTDPYDPAQVKMLVGSPLEHEFDATEIRPRDPIVTPPPLDPNKGCYLEAADIRNAELYPYKAKPSWKMRADYAIIGNAVNTHKPDFHRQNIRGLLFAGVQLHTTMYKDPKFMAAVNYTGYEDVWYLGYQPMQSDGSIKAQVPCNQTFMFWGVDDKGMAIAHDAMLMNLPQGETRTCYGCHDGHYNERRIELGIEPQAAFAKTLAAKTTPPLLNGRYKVTFPEVAPILTKACGGCHKGFENDSLLWSRMFADQEQLDLPWMKRMPNMNGSYWLPRPYFSPLFARYARWSMWVWIASGQRLDGFSNAELVDDYDYPDKHPPVPVTAAEIRKVVDYIQLGAPR